MSSLSIEEENYVRMGLLLTGISPRAARALFDHEFHPSCLGASIKKEHNKLFNMRKKSVISQPQWNLLFPRSPDVPKSDTFDVTLIITLLRNLTNLNPPQGGFDRLPAAIETTPGSDLARLKYYRNYLAHLNDAMLDNNFFTTSWEDISQAVGRLGGKSLKQECDLLKTKTLDQTNKEIIMEIKQSNEAIKELKKSLHSLKRSYDEDKKTVKRLKTENAEGHINKQIEIWEKEDQMFVSTRASDYVMKCLQENSCVTLTAPAGVGKSFIARHAALFLQKEGYKIIPVYFPIDIRNYYQPGKHTVFIVDDICGNFTANQQQIENWKQLLPLLNTIIADKCCKIIVSCRLQVYKDDKFNILPPFKSCECNLISDELCLTSVEKRDIADMFIGTNSKNLSEEAKGCEFFPLLCYLYHKQKDVIIDLNEFFEHPFNIYRTEFDNLARHGDEGKYKVCSLALCVLFNNKLQERWFQGTVTVQQRQILEDTCEACRLNRSTSMAELKVALNTLEGTFIFKQNGIYRTLHDKLFDFLAHYFGQKMIGCFIDHGDVHLLEERFVWQNSSYDKNRNTEFIIEITDDYLEAYLKRLVKDWSKGMVRFVFDKKDMKVSSFRQRLLHYLRKLDKSKQITLINTKEPLARNLEYYNYYPLKMACKHGFTDIVQWMLQHDVDVNQCNYYGVTGLFMACQEGHTTIVNMLLEKSPNVDLGNLSNETPLLKACQKECFDIVKLLLERNCNVNLSNNQGVTPLITSCFNNNISIVQLLLQYKPVINAQTNEGGTALYYSALCGNVEITQLLLVNKADCNIYTYSKDYLKRMIRGWVILEDNVLNALMENPPLNVQDYFEKTERYEDTFYDHESYDFELLAGSSPLHIACFMGWTNVVRCLLKHESNINKTKEDGSTSLSNACKVGHTDIVKILLDQNANVDLCDNDGFSPLIKSCLNNNTSTVKLLIKHKPDINARAFDGGNALFFSALNGNLEITQLLLDNSADCNICFNSKITFDSHASLYQTHKEVLYSLVNNTSTNAADYLKKKSDDLEIYFAHDTKTFLTNEKAEHYALNIVAGSSPLHIACFMGGTDVVRCLLEHKANINMTKEDGTTPLYYACELGHTEIVKILLDQNAYVDPCDNDGFTPLIKSCMNNHTSTVQLLIKHKPDINARTVDGTNALFFSAFNGNLEISKLLLENNADCNNCIHSKQLMIQSLSGHPKEIIHQKKIDFCDILVNGTSKYIRKYVSYKSLRYAFDIFSGSSPLHIACFMGGTDVVRCLLGHKANINMTKEDGTTPLYYACELGHTEIVKILLDQNANIESCDNDGFTPLIKSCMNNHTSTVQLLIKHKPAINAQTNDGYSALFFSALNGNLEITQLLLENSANCNICFYSKDRIINTLNNLAILKKKKRKIFDNLLKSTSRKTALYLRGKYLDYETLKPLIKNSLGEGFGISESVDYAFDVVAGSLPLHIACFMDRADVVRCLLEHESNINITKEDGSTPLSYACEVGHTDIVKILLDQNANVDLCDNDGTTPLIKSCLNNNTSTIQLLIKHKPDINARALHGLNALFLSAINGNLEIIQLLLKNGADCNICCDSKECVKDTSSNLTKKTLKQKKQDIFNIIVNTLSSIANDYLHDKSVRDTFFIHLKHYKEKEVYDNEEAIDHVFNVVTDSSPLHIACFMRRKDVVRSLLEHKANINIAKEDGTTPLFYACEVGHEDSVRLLLDKGADPQMCRLNGKSPLNIATDNGHESVVIMLRKFSEDQHIISF